ncbi:molybdopterin converting factor [Paenibacillus glucanolyticus]|jgi:molybdopterin converting factor subunit 1|uniref:molybdenum cofactor biosynthesis protein MoaE n=1 Tax=Paenibacillus TaxID=44249 RepID=UPI0003E269BB|nr:MULTISPECIES: molybdenum cofactor biosynthesis protein MoaE [Paenibacillus]ANA78941.1 molybdopterin converting factor [Paenibacillus glucanolyticus]AVV57141.1 molybdopterin converting factor [Paenibacillus glucanolyticus]ETT32112.1 molybdopterin converting factor subunit 1 [Paenibacillus sp. FSL R5-808]
MSTTIPLLLFAGLADRIGTGSLAFNVPGLPLTAGELKSLLSEAYPHAKSQIATAFVAVNQEYALSNQLIQIGDEVALIPPVSGGDGTEGDAPDSKSSTDGNCLITYDKLSVEEAVAKVHDANHGATLSFIGTTREMTGEMRTVTLEYEAYIPMALKEMQQICADILSQWPGTQCAISHRIGTVGIGETSVVIAVSSPHRASCYDASRYAIEQLKRSVPIWKKEIWDDGSEWKGPQTGPWDPMIRQ